VGELTGVQFRQFQKSFGYIPVEMLSDSDYVRGCHNNTAAARHKFMKCTYCGRENPNNATLCQGCGAEFGGPAMPASAQSETGYVISPAERRFWECMTFRQFAIFLIRLQSIWLLFNAIEMATYSLTYVHFYKPSYSFLHVELRSGFYMYLFRLILHVAAAVACIQKAEWIVSWFVKDLVPKEAPVPEVTRPGDSEWT
jgi:hypothetical protein